MDNTGSRSPEAPIHPISPSAAMPADRSVATSGSAREGTPPPAERDTPRTGRTPPPGKGKGQGSTATDHQPSGIDLSEESAAGEEDPGAAIESTTQRR